MRIINFWYPQSVQFFITLWKNSMSFLEEDLTVGLNIKLLFVPLFHDSSFVGKLLSFFFRLGRIFIGCFAYIAASFVILVFALFWFTVPVGLIFSLLFFKPLFWMFFSVLIAGIGLLIHEIINNQPKRVWHVKDTGQIWQATRIKKEV